MTMKPKYNLNIIYNKFKDEWEDKDYEINYNDLDYMSTLELKFEDNSINIFILDEDIKSEYFHVDIYIEKALYTVLNIELRGKNRLKILENLLNKDKDLINKLLKGHKRLNSRFVNGLEMSIEDNTTFIVLKNLDYDFEIDMTYSISLKHII